MVSYNGELIGPTVLFFLFLIIGSKVRSSPYMALSRHLETETGALPRNQQSYYASFGRRRPVRSEENLWTSGILRRLEYSVNVHVYPRGVFESFRKKTAL